MKASDRYLKIVEWSDEDQCYVGTCPSLMLGGVHGTDEKKVYAELCQVVNEWIQVYQEDDRPLPQSTANKMYSGKFMLRLGQALHKELAISALKCGTSLNTYCASLLTQSYVMPLKKSATRRVTRVKTLMKELRK